MLNMILGNVSSIFKLMGDMEREDYAIFKVNEAIDTSLTQLEKSANDLSALYQNKSSSINTNNNIGNGIGKNS